MTTQITNSALIRPDARVHFVGIGGIGMSGVAQMLIACGCKVSGSDRAIDNPENQRILAPLKKQGIALYPQDGSYRDEITPDALVYSTAIEEDNPDFVRGEGIPRVHRSDALAAGIRLCPNPQSIAVTGSAGKTSVTAWIAETFELLGLAPSFIDGGLLNRFISSDLAGNFRRGDGEFLVFEADESDKSLLAYEPDYAVVLNIGTDHYSKEELIEVFSQFLRQVKRGAVIGQEALSLLPEECYQHLDVTTFSDTPVTEGKHWQVTSYQASSEQVTAKLNNSLEIKLPAPGYHTALNAATVLATVDMIGGDTTAAGTLLAQFQGVWRRYNLAGQLDGTGPRVYDDYAHNVEKIAACMKAAQEIAAGQLFAVFQPHGFGPLGFMRDPLLEKMESTLRSGDVFAMLPVFYAGGTTSFKPTAESVIQDYSEKGTHNYVSFDSRPEAQEFFRDNCTADDIVLVMGARDNSLSDWTVELCGDES